MSHIDMAEDDAERVPLPTTAGRYGAADRTYLSANRSSRGGRKVTGVVIHTAEGIRKAWDLGAFFAPTSREASSHEGADDSERVAYVPYEYAAWTLRNGNPWTDNLELCGFASWTRAQWLQHPGMLRHAGEWVGERCRARGVPIVKLTPEQIARGERSGVFAHWDYTKATGDGTHWDVGTSFPWDVVLGIAKNGADTALPASTVWEDDSMMQLRRNSATGTISLTHPNGLWWDCPGPAYVTLAVARQVAALPAIEMNADEVRWLRRVYGVPTPTGAPSTVAESTPLFGLEEDQVLAALDAEGIPVLTDDQIMGVAPIAG